MSTANLTPRSLEVPTLESRRGALRRDPPGRPYLPVFHIVVPSVGRVVNYDIVIMHTSYNNKL